MPLALAAACSPALNWRAIPVPGAPLSVHFPCKPDHFSRRLGFAGQTSDVGVSSCTAESQTFAVTAVDMKDEARSGAGLAALRDAVRQNYAGHVQALPTKGWPACAGMAPAEQFEARALRAQGGTVQARLLLFSRGAWVFQATVVGERLQPEAVDFFFDSLKPLP